MIIVLCPNPSVDKMLHLDELLPGEVNRSTGETPYPGGKGVHVSMALKELQTDNKLIGFWGGPAGEWIRKECSRKGISTYGPELEGWTRTCLTILTPDASTRNTEILEKGPEITSGDLLKFFDISKSQTENARTLCVSGSWPANSPDDVYQVLKSICDENSIDLWVDASGERLEQALEAEPFGVHINRQEARGFFGGDLPAGEYARKLLNHCSMAAVTDGANGLYLAYQSEVIHASCRVDHVISTVGSGDCLTAGVISEWYRSGDLNETARTGTACGAANCIYPELGIIRREDVRTLKAATTITRLED